LIAPPELTRWIPRVRSFCRMYDGTGAQTVALKSAFPAPKNVVVNLIGTSKPSR
jgi:hypothetical protein